MRTYVIIDASEVSNINFDDILQDSVDSLVYSLDGSKTFVKFEGDTPSFLIGEPQYNHEEMTALLSGPEWSDPDANP